MRLNRLWILLAVLVLGACVPNRKYVYLQKDDLHKKDIPLDTILRTYNVRIDEYRIQPLDLISIRLESLTDEEFDFFSKLYPSTQGGGNNQLVNGFQVDNNGDIEFPVVGRLHFQGLSTFEAEDLLERAFAPHLSNPVARIRLLNFRVTMLGEVNSERQVTSTNSRLTLLEAIGMAGGLSELADRSKIKIIRQDGNTAGIFYANLLDEELLETEHYYLQQNDIIIVPPLKQRPFRRYWGSNISIFVSTVSVVLLMYNLLSNN